MGKVKRHYRVLASSRYCPIWLHCSCLQQCAVRDRTGKHYLGKVAPLAGKAPKWGDGRGDRFVDLMQGIRALAAGDAFVLPNFLLTSRLFCISCYHA